MATVQRHPVAVLEARAALISNFPCMPFTTSVSHGPSHPFHACPVPVLMIAVHETVLFLLAALGEMVWTGAARLLGLGKHAHQGIRSSSVVGVPHWQLILGISRGVGRMWIAQ